MKLLSVLKKYNNAILKENARLRSIYSSILSESKLSDVPEDNISEGGPDIEEMSGDAFFEAETAFQSVDETSAEMNQMMDDAIEQNECGDNPSMNQMMDDAIEQNECGDNPSMNQMMDDAITEMEPDVETIAENLIEDSIKANSAENLSNEMIDIALEETEKIDEQNISITDAKTWFEELNEVDENPSDAKTSNVETTDGTEEVAVDTTDDTEASTIPDDEFQAAEAFFNGETTAQETTDQNQQNENEPEKFLSEETPEEKPVDKKSNDKSDKKNKTAAKKQDSDEQTDNEEMNESAEIKRFKDQNYRLFVD